MRQSGPDPLWNITVTGCIALKDPGQVESDDLYSGVADFRAAFEEQKDETLRRRAGTSRNEGGIGAERFVDEAVRPPSKLAQRVIRFRSPPAVSALLKRRTSWPFTGRRVIPSFIP